MFEPLHSTVFDISVCNGKCCRAVYLYLTVLKHSVKTVILFFVAFAYTGEPLERLPRDTSLFKYVETVCENFAIFLFVAFVYRDGPLELLPRGIFLFKRVETLCENYVIFLFVAYAYRTVTARYISVY